MHMAHSRSSSGAHNEDPCDGDKEPLRRPRPECGRPRSASRVKTARTEPPSAPHACIAQEISALVMLGKALLGTPDEGDDGEEATNLIAAAACGGNDEVSDLGSLVLTVVQERSGSRGSNAVGAAFAASKASATSSVEASCNGLNMRKPLRLAHGSAPPVSSTRTASSAPIAAAACKAVVACPCILPLPFAHARTFGDEARVKVSATSAASPRAAALTKATSSSSVETEPLAW
eukprot:CAMPEP_0169317270 /NCGR_PEP_ID=MMETSP1017-20121227/6625_1 /TAXON_ID=342587 /ORGANISM="Karlodinium micrum, Strain CCMP2283" /LENGTH=232 /DNA_ID=CAMNT_0009411391 /DNA_START=337 /DNA_END=1038 /DNA_ORIENTATION=-